jgi:hypothetical protein
VKLVGPGHRPEFFAACHHCGAPGTDIIMSDDVEQIRLQGLKAIPV